MVFGFMDTEARVFKTRIPAVDVTTKPVMDLDRCMPIAGSAIDGGVE